MMNKNLKLMKKTGCYNSAINVCNEAISKGYSDGTKGDFESRIQKLKEKQNKLNNYLLE